MAKDNKGYGSNSEDHRHQPLTLNSQSAGDGFRGQKPWMRAVYEKIGTNKQIDQRIKSGKAWKE